MSAEFPTYQPSVFYFRKLLRESSSLSRAQTVALIAASELEQLKLWAADERILPNEDGIAYAAECMCRAIRQSRSRGQVILLGLFLCHELEQLKALVREHGMIPPKWIIAPEEAEEKGWTVEESGMAQDF